MRITEHMNQIHVTITEKHQNQNTHKMKNIKENNKENKKKKYGNSRNLLMLFVSFALSLFSRIVVFKSIHNYMKQNAVCRCLTPNDDA